MILIMSTVDLVRALWYTLSMITPDEIRIGSKYWFIFGDYSAFGTFAERDGDIITVSEALIYLTANRSKLFFEERLIIDGRKLKDIRINDDGKIEDHSDFYSRYDYGNQK